MTPQRKSIIDVIVTNQGNHLSAEEIYELVKGFQYWSGNNIWTLQILTILVSYIKILDDGKRRYELYQDEDHQHHLICIKCSRVVEVEEDLLEQLEDEVEKKI